MSLIFLLQHRISVSTFCIRVLLVTVYSYPVRNIPKYFVIEADCVVYFLFRTLRVFWGVGARVCVSFFFSREEYSWNISRSMLVVSYIFLLLH